MIKRLLSPPRFDDLEQDFRAKFINGFAWIAMTLVTIVTFIVAITGFTDYTVYVLIGLVIVFALTIVLLRKRLLNLSAVTLVILTWVGIFFQAYTADGIRDVIIIGFIAGVIAKFCPQTAGTRRTPVHRIWWSTIEGIAIESATVPGWLRL